MSHIAGTFDSAPLANEAIARLLSLGLTKDNISLVMSDKTKSHFSAATKDTGDRTVVDAAIGASTGGVLGALVAGLTTVGAIVIPGAQILAVGPLISLLSGLGAGAALGGIAGALSAVGIAAAESSQYESAIKAGKAVIIVHATSDKQDLQVRAALMNEGAVVNAA